MGGHLLLRPLRHPPTHHPPRRAGFLTSFDGLIGVTAGHGREPGRRRGLPGEDRLAKASPLPREPAVSDRARLDVSAPVLKAVTGWIARHRRRPGTRPAQPA